MSHLSVWKLSQVVLCITLIHSLAWSGSIQERYFEFATTSPSEKSIATTSDSSVISLVEQQLALPQANRNLHIHGRIAQGNGGHNYNWSWHFVPDQWDLAEISMEVCDGRCSYVESDLSYWLSLGLFCPWDSYVVREVFFHHVDLQDAIISLQITAGIPPTGVINLPDINGDKKTGLEEAVYILQGIGGIRLLFESHSR